MESKIKIEDLHDGKLFDDKPPMPRDQYVHGRYAAYNVADGLGGIMDEETILGYSFAYERDPIIVNAENIKVMLDRVTKWALVQETYPWYSWQFNDYNVKRLQVVDSTVIVRGAYQSSLIFLNPSILLEFGQAMWNVKPPKPKKR